MTILPHQQTSYAELKSMLFASSKLEGCSIKPRLIPFLVGPSGSGKTSMVQAFAEEQSIPYLRVTPGTWGILNSRGEVHTLDLIHEFLQGSMALLLHLDEVDKLGDIKADWSLTVMQEIFSILDRQPLAEAGWEDDQINILQHSTLLVASGTWQSIWDIKSGIGFGANGEYKESGFIHSLEKQAAIPEELIRRLGWPPIIMRLPTAKELEQASQVTGLESALIKADISPDWDALAASRRGVRCLEMLATQAAIKLGQQEKEDLKRLAEQVQKLMCTEP